MLPIGRYRIGLVTTRLRDRASSTVEEFLKKNYEQVILILILAAQPLRKLCISGILDIHGFALSKYVVAHI